MSADASSSSSPSSSEFVRLLRAQRVWDTELPRFSPDTAPAEPLPLFERWFAEAVAAGQTEPHTMSLATVDEEDRPDVRIVMLHGADEEGWHFASHAGSRKGRQLAVRPYAALCFYWPAQGRQVRVRGRVAVAPPEAAHADLHARSTGALASALVGRQSEVLDSYEELERASDAAWRRAQHEPDAPAPSWTAYVLSPEEVEFSRAIPGDATYASPTAAHRRLGAANCCGRESDVLRLRPRGMIAQFPAPLG